MTSDSGRHAQRGDVQQAPPEGCQSVIAQRIPTSPPIGTDEDLIVRLRKYGHIEAADALLSRIAEVERLEGHVRALIMLVEANTMPLSKDEYRYVQEARATLSLHGKV